MLRPRLLVPLALLIAAALAWVALRPDPVAHPSGPGRALAFRGPDLVLRQPGRLVPDEDVQWGAFGPHGWEDRTDERDGEPFVVARELPARLVLPSNARRDRTLSLRLWTVGEGAEADASASIRLNDVTLEEVPVGPEPRTVEVDAPGPVWQQGANGLALHLQGGARGTRLAVAEVAYGRIREPEVDPARGRLELSPDTGVVYRLEEVAPLDLHVAATAGGPGTLELDLGRIDPATGERVAELRGYELPLEAGRLERTIPLPEAEGDVLELRVAWRAPEDGSGDATLAFERLAVLDREPVERVPVILIAVDTLAARSTSVYGYDRDTTPELARFAEDAVTFERAVANATWTLPSFMSMMTGVHANAHRLDRSPTKGVRRRLWETWYLAENRWTLAEALRAAGWETAGFVDNLWITDRFGFPQGFDVYDASAGEIDKLDPDGGIRHVAARALSWLDARDPDDPFFLFVHCFDVHGPYSAEAPFEGRFRDDALYEEETRRPAGSMSNVYGSIPTYITAGEYPEGETPPVLPTGPVTALYDEGVAFTDHELGRFLDALRERGVYDRALIVVTADHGETMDRSEYLFGHGVLDEAVVHVPLLVKLPGSEGGGRRVPDRVQLLDLYPTLLELAGLPHERGYLNGRSLVPLLEGGELPPAPTLSEAGLMYQSAVHEGDWKLVVQIPSVQSGEHVILTYPLVPEAFLRRLFPEVAGRTLTEELLASAREADDWKARIRELRRALNRPVVRLYDLATDPDERKDLSQAEPERLARMLELGRTLWKERDLAKRLARPPAAPASLSAQDVAELAALGYGDGE